MSALTPSSARQWPRLTLFLLVFGWLILGMGELAGLVLLWGSTIWTRRQRVIGTLIPIAEIGIVICLALGTYGNACDTHGCTGSSPSVGNILAMVVAVALVPVICWATLQLVRRD